MLIMVCILSVAVLTPFSIYAQGGIIPDCERDNTDPSPECGFLDLIKMMNNVIDFIITLALPISAVIFAWSGFEIMTTGIADKKSQARSRIMKVFVGLVIVLSAWIVTEFLAKALIKSDLNINTFIG